MTCLDLRTAPNWNPERHQWSHGRWHVNSWREPALPGTESYDADMLTPAARQAWQQAIKGVVRDPVRTMQIQEELLDDPAVWAYPTLGLVQDPALRATTVEDLEEIIVSTDGARLTPERREDLLG